VEVRKRETPANFLDPGGGEGDWDLLEKKAGKGQSKKSLERYQRGTTGGDGTTIKNRPLKASTRERPTEGEGPLGSIFVGWRLFVIREEKPTTGGPWPHRQGKNGRLWGKRPERRKNCR